MSLDSPSRLQAATLADAALPRRAKLALENAQTELRARLEPQLPLLLQDTGQALAQTAPVDTDEPQQAARQAALYGLSHNTAAFSRRVLAALESALANLQTPRRTPDPTPVAPSELALLDEATLDEQATLTNIASRLEARNSLALQLLGHRLGVLATTPALEGEQLPLGPYSLCRALMDAADALQLPTEARRLLLLQFEKRMTELYPELLDACNARLIQDGILPHLSFIPVRVQPSSTRRSTAPSNADATRPASPNRATPADIHTTAAAMPDFNALRALLQQRRLLLDKLRPGSTAPSAREPLSQTELLDALHHLRRQAVPAASLDEYRQILLAQARQTHGHGMTLATPDNDSFELLSLYLAQLRRQLRPRSPGDTLVERLRLPLLQLVLRDPGFFTQPAHPARQLLNAVSVAGARWLAADDIDNQWLGLLQRAVTSVQQDDDGKPETFAEANQTLQSGLMAQARRIEMAERRQIEAARGREKLALARQRAAQVLDGLRGGRSLGRFQSILLEQAWLDVLALTHLRSGEHDSAWQEVLDTSARIIDILTGTVPPPDDDALASRIRDALAQVGYHGADAAAIAAQLVQTAADEGLASRTELLVQLRARARLGEGSEPQAAPPVPLTPSEQDARERLRTLPCPVWVELLDPNDDPLRRRLAWVSAHTAQALLLNRRGQRIGTEDLDVLARMLAAGHLRILERDVTPAEAAWETLLASLQRTSASDAALATAEVPDGD